MVLNLAVAGLSLSDMYLLASGAVRVGLPQHNDFSWHYDPASMSVVFEGNYTVVTSTEPKIPALLMCRGPAFIPGAIAGELMSITVEGDQAIILRRPEATGGEGNIEVRLDAMEVLPDLHSNSIRS
jgi:hypothetical protein